VNSLTYSVVVKASGAGSLNLGINSATAINDHFGKPLAVPVADTTTYNVNASSVAGELGVWKPWANGGINPAAGSPWKAGDTYHSQHPINL
jgi:hypothetical protein